MAEDVDEGADSCDGLCQFAAAEGNIAALRAVEVVAWRAVGEEDVDARRDQTPHSLHRRRLPVEVSVRPWCPRGAVDSVSFHLDGLVDEQDTVLGNEINEALLFSAERHPKAWGSEYAVMVARRDYFVGELLLIKVCKKVKDFSFSAMLSKISSTKKDISFRQRWH